MCPEKHGPAREKCSFVDFGGGVWYRRPWSGLAVAGEPKALHNHLLCCLPNLHAAFWPGNPADKLTRSAAARLFSNYTRIHTHTHTHTFYFVLFWCETVFDSLRREHRNSWYQCRVSLSLSLSLSLSRSQKSGLCMDCSMCQQNRSGKHSRRSPPPVYAVRKETMGCSPSRPLFYFEFSIPISKNHICISQRHLPKHI